LCLHHFGFPSLLVPSPVALKGIPRLLRWAAAGKHDWISGTRGPDGQTDRECLLVSFTKKKKKKGILPVPFQCRTSKGVQKNLERTSLRRERKYQFSFFKNFRVFFIVEVCVKCFVVEVFFFKRFIYSLLCFVLTATGGYSKFLLITRSRRLLRPLRTPDPHRQCPWEPRPLWADGRSSGSCTRRRSCPTGLCVSCTRPPARRT